MMTEEEWEEFEGRRSDSFRWSLTEQAKVRHILFRHQGGLCAICGTRMGPRDKLGNATLDHVIAKAMGGVNGLGNLVAAHRVCNHRKGSTPPTGCTLIWLLAVNNRLGVEPMRW